MRRPRPNVIQSSARVKYKNGDLNNVNALEDQFCDMTAEYVVQKKISDYFN